MNRPPVGPEWWPPYGDAELAALEPDPPDRVDDDPMPVTPAQVRRAHRINDDPWDNPCTECGGRFLHAGRCTRIGGPGYTTGGAA